MKYLLVASALVASAAASDVNPMVDNAIQFIARASSTSEVLTLNLTNLLILLALKVLVIAFGFFSLGSSARSFDEVPTFSQADLTGGMCFMMYTSGDYEKITCVQRTACEDPALAKQYITGAKLWYNMHKMFNTLVPFGKKYEEVLTGVEDAIAHSANGGDCAVYEW